MDELLARIHPDPTILQLQCGMPKFGNLDTRDIEIEGLAFDMEAVLRDSPTPLHKLRIVLRRPIAGNHMNVLGRIDGFVYEIDMLQHPHIDSGHFSCMMAAHDVIDLIQSSQVIIPSIISITDSQPFACMHVEEGEFAVRKVARSRNRGTQNLAAEQQEPDNRRFEK